jgi:hypothetical protein
MRRAQGLLLRCARLARGATLEQLAVSAQATHSCSSSRLHPTATALAQLLHSRSLHRHLLEADAPGAPSPALAASYPKLAPHPLGVRQLHTSTPTCDATKAAAVRRLAAAKSRRERAVEAAATSGRAPDQERADALSPEQQQGALVPVPTGPPVTPAEGKASEAQVGLDKPLHPHQWPRVVAVRGAQGPGAGTAAAAAASRGGGASRGRQLAGCGVQGGPPRVSAGRRGPCVAPDAACVS